MACSIQSGKKAAGKLSKHSIERIAAHIPQTKCALRTSGTGLICWHGPEFLVDRLQTGLVKSAQSAPEKRLSGTMN
jgi:hypothetical protein